ncbi:MAG: class I SAM-dependent methyltransferase [Chloroflexi bacterium]|nr:class I SAM-dependent methyltransferase [Chloroflexota bacterium]
MKNASNYRRWLFDQVSPHIGKRVLEIGAGIGNYTQFLVDADVTVCVEIHPEAVALLKERFRSNPKVFVYHGDVADPALRSLAEHRCDTAICFNVLEHVEQDVTALKNIADILVPGGRLLLIVPALSSIFSPVDRALGHYRRYSVSSLRRSLDQAGYHVEHISWMNLLGIMGWLYNGHILRRNEESHGQIIFYDRVIVPWLRILERVIRPPIGLSLVCVAKSVLRQPTNAL